MCTVTYLPESDEKFILTSSRDEKASRLPAGAPALHAKGERKILYPKDQNAGGTWIATDGILLVCLLNGAFEKHTPNPPYRKSRGHVVPDVFLYSHPIDFYNDYDLVDIEPFTLIIHFDKHLYEFRWDGQKKYLRECDSRTPMIWSSVTLYPTDVILKREQWFKEYLEESRGKSIEDLRYFHHNGGKEDFENAIKVNRGSLFTVSITSVIKDHRNAEMIYEDLINNEIHKVSI